ncbi:MAG TPA: S24/S26 family peptidase [Polyangiaceae bacterium]|nr:S24/S26 family peptidase [Polyangiaceae bacterium]
MASDPSAGPPVMVTPFRGQSMLPSLLPGDRIVWRRLDGTSFPPVGSVVAYSSGPRFISHRVIRVDRDRSLVWTRPDAAFQPDPPVPLGEIHWLAIEVQRKGRSFPPTPPGEWTRLITCATLTPVRLARSIAGKLLRRIRHYW